MTLLNSMGNKLLAELMGPWNMGKQLDISLLKITQGYTLVFISPVGPNLGIMIQGDGKREK